MNIDIERYQKLSRMMIDGRIRYRREGDDEAVCLIHLDNGKYSTVKIYLNESAFAILQLLEAGFSYQ